MPTILSHRGNRVGPWRSAENSLRAIHAALAQGYGLETDIRRADTGRFYIAHDPQPWVDQLPAVEVFSLIRQFPAATIALNIKELGHEAALLDLLADAGILDQVFLFDMELLEPEPGATARRFRDLDADVRLAARVSDRGETIDRALAIDVADVVWLDEFDGPLFTGADVRRLRDAGREVHAVSPDLHGGSLDAARRRWADFIAWGVDGICTDYPASLERQLRDLAQEAA